MEYNHQNPKYLAAFKVQQEIREPPNKWGRQWCPNELRHILHRKGYIREFLDTLSEKEVRELMHRMDSHGLTPKPKQ